MRSLLRFFEKNHIILLFLFLETVSMILIFNYNNYQKVKFLNSSNNVAGSISNSFTQVRDYFRLSSVNDELALENSRLKNELSLTKNSLGSSSVLIIDSITQYKFQSAKVIYNSVYRQYNYLTLNKGEKHGIKKDQGIISANGVVGVILNVSESYSTGISLLNKRLPISCMLKKNNYYGSLEWDGRNYRIVQLNDIPFHVEVGVGDTIITSGRSLYFPEGIMIGAVDSYSRNEGDNFYSIDVLLSADFQSLSYVDVIENRDKQEIIELQQNTINEEKLD